MKLLALNQLANPFLLTYSQTFLHCDWIFDILIETAKDLEEDSSFICEWLPPESSQV